MSGSDPVTHPTSEPTKVLQVCAVVMHADGTLHVLQGTEAVNAAVAALPPNQALDDIGVDDGATDGHAVSVNRSSGPSREEEKASGGAEK